MNNFVNQFNEIGSLKTVMLHRPDVEVEQIIPEYLEQMLAEDTPYVPAAQKEHDVFAKILSDNGVCVLYLKDLFCESVKDKSVREKYIDDYVSVAGVKGESLRAAVKEYLADKSPAELFYEVCKGVKRSDLMGIKPLPIPLQIEEAYPFVTDPIPNVYFTRDVGICVGNGMIISHMSMPSRVREALFVRYIHDFHPDFAKVDVPLWYDKEMPYSIEGGDVLVLSDKVLAIGCGERTTIAAVEQLALRLFNNGYERILVFNNPRSRKYMHLDVLCTMVDRDKFLVHPCIYDKQFNVYELTKGTGCEPLAISCTTDPVDKIFARVLKIPAVKFIEVGGGDPIIAAREHWNMGGNSLAISPANIITYNRNDVTNELLTKAGIKVNTIPGGELSRGRGGPRCMSMPINRDNI